MKKRFHVVVKFPGGKKEVFTVEASSEWDARNKVSYSPEYLWGRKGEVL